VVGFWLVGFDFYLFLVSVISDFCGVYRESSLLGLLLLGLVLSVLILRLRCDFAHAAFGGFCFCFHDHDRGLTNISYLYTFIEVVLHIYGRNS